MSRRTILAIVLCSCSLVVQAQEVSGVLFDDRNGNGQHDAGEPVLEGWNVDLLGESSSQGSLDQSTLSGVDGRYQFLPNDGCYLLAPDPPADWRPSLPRPDRLAEGTAGYVAPAGMPRFGSLAQAASRLRSGSLKYASLGDSIGWNWNSCFYQSSFWYSRQVRSRISCAVPAASITLDEAAIKGEHTDDLLVNDSDDGNNVFRQFERQPDFLTLSMIGNDLLGVDAGNAPTQQETNRAIEEVLDARANLQEAISSLLTEIPNVDITLNTLYDNESYDCGATQTSDFHREWMPIVNRVLRDLAWGQSRPVGINEVAPEFGLGALDGSCTGFSNRICRDFFSTDLIHPNNQGYEILREKVWEAAGGVSLGAGDVLGRSAQSDADFGFARRVRRLLPTQSSVLNGATAATPEAAFDDQDGGASASIGLGIGGEEFRLAGFPDWYDEIAISRVIVGVRYRVSGVVNDDFYRIEASPSGTFRAPPGYAYAIDNWNFYTPLVGGGGPNMPASNADYANANLLAVPQPASLREVTATLTQNPVLVGGSADYEWPSFTSIDLGTVEIRVAAAAVAGTAGNDNWTVELDAGWLDLYGSEKPRPDEVQQLRLEKPGNGDLILSFDTLPDAARYNLYFGRLSALGSYDHGTGAPREPDCAAADTDAGGGRRRITVLSGDIPLESIYFLVTGHVDDVESPAGTDSDGGEIDRAQSICF
jgi:lysophospholipase L1-like esterase